MAKLSKTAKAAMRAGMDKKAAVAVITTEQAIKEIRAALRGNLWIPNHLTEMLLAEYDKATAEVSKETVSELAEAIAQKLSKEETSTANDA